MPTRAGTSAVTHELRRRQDRLLERRHKLARFRDPERLLDTFDFDLNKKMNRALVYELATPIFDGAFIGPGKGLPGHVWLSETIHQPGVDEVFQHARIVRH